MLLLKLPINDNEDDGDDDDDDDDELAKMMTKTERLPVTANNNDDMYEDNTIKPKRFDKNVLD